MHGAFPAISGASGVKIWHPQRTGRKKRERVGGYKASVVRDFTTWLDWAAVHILGFSIFS
jgi:hypothetical protein